MISHVPRFRNHASGIVSIFFASLICVFLQITRYSYWEKASLVKFQIGETTATTQAITPARGRLFACGYVYDTTEFMFPDYEYMGRDVRWDLLAESDENNNNDNDILLAGLYGPGCDDSERTEFSGKILYLDGEGYGNPVSETWSKKHLENQQELTDEIYQIGPYPRKVNTNNDDNGNDSDDFYNSHSLEVYYMVVDYLHMELSEFRSNVDVDPSAAILESGYWKLLVEGNKHGNGNGFNKHERIHAIVYTQTHVVAYRQDAARLLADTFTSKTTASFLHYSGGCTVPNGIPVPMNLAEEFPDRERLGDERMTNFETAFTRYKYCLVMENSLVTGYISEKLMQALLSGCLPIYYGDKAVYNIFRDESFVYYDIDNPELALAEIRHLEENPAEYERRTSRELPLLKQTFNTNTNKMDTFETVDRYFSLIPGRGTGRISREIHEMMGLPLPVSLRNDI